MNRKNFMFKFGLTCSIITIFPVVSSLNCFCSPSIFQGIRPSFPITLLMERAAIIPVILSYSYKYKKAVYCNAPLFTYQFKFSDYLRALASASVADFQNWLRPKGPTSPRISSVSALYFFPSALWKVIRHL